LNECREEYGEQCAGQEEADDRLEIGEVAGAAEHFEEERLHGFNDWPVQRKVGVLKRWRNPRNASLQHSTDAAAWRQFLCFWFLSRLGAAKNRNNENQKRAKVFLPCIWHS